MTKARPEVTLGLHLNSHGFGWIGFTGPFEPKAWAFVRLDDKGSKLLFNDRCARRVAELLGKIRPQTLVLESFDTSGRPRSKRIQALSREILEGCREAGIPVSIYTRTEIATVFSGAKTRDETAHAVAQRVPSLARILPAKRRLWDGEDNRLAIFNAAALVLTDYAKGAGQLLDDLKRRA